MLVLCVIAYLRDMLLLCAECSYGVHEDGAVVRKAD